MKPTYPLVLAFYINRDTDQIIVSEFRKSIDVLLEQKKQDNVLVFFLPTEGEDRLECINPVTAPDEKMMEVTQLITDIKKSFNI